MAELHYHIHRARPVDFADTTAGGDPVPVIRLFLFVDQHGRGAIWLFRRGEWSQPRYSNGRSVPPPPGPGAVQRANLNGR